jgi:mono/diheme cytochrome c family protein
VGLISKTGVMSMSRVVFVSALFLSVLTACKSGALNEAAICPQDRYTELAPASIASKQNPLQANKDNLDAGRHLYEKDITPVPCIECHGKRGDGNGRMANMFEPAPRNFACSQIMDGIPDGQLYWIIKNGSIGTSMPAFEKLDDDEIWQLVMYIRQFSKAQ